MNSDQARQRAQQSFKQGKSALASRTPLTEYETKARATREKIARLKALRLAKQTQVKPNSRRNRQAAPATTSAASHTATDSNSLNFASLLERYAAASSPTTDRAWGFSFD